MTAPRQAKIEFEKQTGKTWAVALVQHALDTAWNCKAIDRFRVIASDAQHYAKSEKLRERFGGLYDWTARKVGIRKRIRAYWVLDLP